jgi:transposase
MAGRRSKYTPETVDKLTQAIRLGATDELACDYAGIGASTFYAWMEAKPEFQETIKQARGAAAVKWLAKIEQAGEDAWQAFAWKLERRFPQMYGKQALEISGPDGGAIVVKGYANITPDDWQAPVERPDDSDV